MKCLTKKTCLTVLTALIVIDILIFGHGTVSTLRLANPNNIVGPINARELAFRNHNYECKNPSEFISLPYTYSGTKRDILYLTAPFNCGWDTGELSDINNAISIIMSPLILVDLPLSVLADTIVLPYTIYKQNKEGNIIDPPYFHMGNIQRQSGNYDKAITYYEKGFKILPKYYGSMPYHEIYLYLPDFDYILEMFAQHHDKRGDYNQAIFYYDHLREIAVRDQKGPSGPAARRYRDLGNAYSKIGDLDRARECYVKADEYTVPVVVHERQGAMIPQRPPTATSNNVFKKGVVSSH